MAVPIAISCGDHAGIGTEVVLKAIRARRAETGARPLVLIGDRAQVAVWTSRLRMPALPPYTPSGGDPLTILDPLATPLPTRLSAGGPDSARAALAFLKRAAVGCLAGEFAGLVTAPVSKEAILRTGIPFVGQTEFLAEAAGLKSDDVTMMLLGEDAGGRWLRVALVTTHLPLREVADAVTPPRVERALRQTLEACRLLGLTTARIAVCGLNPHAGEGGLLGTEDLQVVKPVVESFRAQGLDVRGPRAADTVFHEAASGRDDAVVAMYHDQGLPALKLLAFETGVNWTLGLPFVRTSPDHGTAFDLAGQGVANPSSTIAALQLAETLAQSYPR